MKSIRTGPYIESGFWSGYQVFIDGDEYRWNLRALRVNLNSHLEDMIPYNYSVAYRLLISSFLSTLIILEIEV